MQVAIRALAIADLDADGDLDVVYAGAAGVGRIISNQHSLEPARAYSASTSAAVPRNAPAPGDAVGVVVAHGRVRPGQCA
ncbi:MAG: hypothetical protein R3F43_01855 [bacterium]